MGAGLNAGEDERLKREREQERHAKITSRDSKTPVLVPIKSYRCSNCDKDMSNQPWSKLCDNCQFRFF